MTSRPIEAGARLVAVSFWYLTAIFAWLISVPFAYQNFIKPRLLPDFVAFAEHHRWLVVLLWPVGRLALRGVLRHPRSGRMARGLLWAWGLAALVLAFVPALDRLPTDRRATLACIATLVFPIGCAIVDLLAAPPLAEPPPLDRTGLDTCAALATAGLVFLFYTAQALARGEISAAGLGASALTHLLTAAALLFVLTAIRALAALRERSVYAEFWLTTVALVVAFSVVVTRLGLPALSVAGTARWLAGTAMAGTMALVIAARGRTSGGDQRDGVLTALSGLLPRGLATPAAGPWLAWLPVVAVVAWGGPLVSRVLDWNFLILTMSVLIVWTLAFASA